MQVNSGSKTQIHAFFIYSSFHHFCFVFYSDDKYKLIFPSNYKINHFVIKKINFWIPFHIHMLGLQVTATATEFEMLFQCLIINFQCSIVLWFEGHSPEGLQTFFNNSFWKVLIINRARFWNEMYRKYYQNLCYQL